MLVTLIHTGEDIAQYETTLAAALRQAGLQPSAGQVVQPSPQPAAQPIAQPIAQPAAQQDGGNGNGGDTTYARAMRVAYAQFSQAYGRKPTGAEKQAARDQFKATGQVNWSAIMGGQIAQPAQVAPQPATPQSDEERIAQAVRQALAAMTPQQAPAVQAQPAQLPGTGIVTRFDTVPQVSQLSQQAQANLMAYTGNLTATRQDIVRKYLAGQATPQDVANVYGDRLPRFVKALNEAVKAAAQPA